MTSIAVEARDVVVRQDVRRHDGDLGSRITAHRGVRGVLDVVGELRRVRDRVPVVAVEHPEVARSSTVGSRRCTGCRRPTGRDLVQEVPVAASYLAIRFVYGLSFSSATKMNRRRVHGARVRLTVRVRTVEVPQVVALLVVHADLEVQVVGDEDLVRELAVAHPPGEDAGTAAAADRPQEARPVRHERRGGGSRPGSAPSACSRRARELPGSPPGVSVFRQIAASSPFLLLSPTQLARTASSWTRSPFISTTYNDVPDGDRSMPHGKLKRPNAVPGPPKAPTNVPPFLQTLIMLLLESATYRKSASVSTSPTCPRLVVPVPGVPIEPRYVPPFE